MTFRIPDHISVQTSSQTASDAQAARILNQAKSSAIGAHGQSDKDAKIAKAGRDFESVLLGSWLQEAEQTFAKVPGGDAQEEDGDSSTNQFQGIAMQALAGSLTASGGIGIARMITRSLHRSEHSSGDAASQSSVPATLTKSAATAH